MPKKIFRSSDAPAPLGPYSQAVGSGGFLFLSGQVGIDPESGKMTQGDLEDEVHQVMRNIQAVLKSADLDLSDVVKCSIFLIDMDAFARVNAVYGSYFDHEPPARETVEVSRLPAGARVEISVVAARVLASFVDDVDAGED